MQKMKKANLSAYFLAGLLLSTATTRATTNLVDDVLAKARFPRDAGTRDPSYAQAELREALNSATLVIKALVVNSNAAVWASTNQHEVSPGQGWAAIAVRPEAVLKGKWEIGDLLTANQYIGHVIDGSAFPMRYSFTNGENGFFFLRPDKRLSRWCATNVFEKIKVVPIK